VRNVAYNEYAFLISSLLKGICMLHDLREAQTFLSLLGRTNYIFQTFDDTPTKDVELVRTFNGTLESYEDKLLALNDKKAGVFVTINESKSNRRLKQDIFKATAIWQEDDADGAVIPELEPSIVVETSKGKFHRYWLIRNGTEDLDTWERVQNILVKKYGSDKNAKDLSRVMRLPGFFHNKGEKFLVKIAAVKEQALYDWATLVEFFLNTKTSAQEDAQQYEQEPDSFEEYEGFDAVAAIRELLAADNFHGSMISLAMHYANAGICEQEIIEILKALFNSSEEKGTPRWQARFAEIPRSASSAWKKIREERGPDPKVELIEQENAYSRYPTAPKHLEAIVQNVLSFMRYPCYEIGVEAALHVISTLAGNYFTFENVPCHRKTVLLASQGRGKNVVTEYLTAVLDELSLLHKNSPVYFNFLGAGDYTSAKQIHLELQEFGSRSMINAEAGHAQSSTAGDRAAMIGYINQVLASKPCAPISPRKQNSLKNEDKMKVLRDVCMTILHESVPSNYAKLLSSREFFADGSVSRTNYVFAGRKTNEINTNTKQIIDRKGLELFAKIANASLDNGDLLNRTQGRPETREIITTERQQRFFEQLEQANLDYESTLEDDSVEHSCIARRVIRIKQAARLCAISRNPENPRMEDKDIAWAVAYVDEINRALLANTKTGVLASVLEIFIQKFRIRAAEYLAGELEDKPSTLEIRRNLLLHTTCSKFNVHFHRHFDLLRQVLPEYKYKDTGAVKRTFYNEMQERGFIHLFEDTDATGRRYTKRVMQSSVRDVSLLLLFKLDKRSKEHADAKRYSEMGPRDVLAEAMGNLGQYGNKVKSKSGLS